VTATRYRLPRGRFIPSGDCACTPDGCCLYHFSTALDWRGQAVALARAGIPQGSGR
jgi:hypothetical protein